MNIEELAFKDRKILANLNAVDLLNIIEFLQDDRRQCLEELSKTHNRSVEIQQENKELKLELSGYRQAILKDKEMLGLKEENDKLKKQLELGEEHNKLKEEITNLSKDVDMWNAKYNDIFDENRELKKQLEEWEHRLKCSKEMLDIQGKKGNYDYDEYMLGLYNGMEYIIALFETREPNFINGKDVEFTNNKTQQKKFIKWLEDESKEVYRDGGLRQNIFRQILQKYRSIIGGNDNE